MKTKLHTFSSCELVDGKIPSGSPCPFLNECNHRNPSCPSNDHLMDDDFSCGIARAHAAIKFAIEKG